jgi:hypothetical protein
VINLSPAAMAPYGEILFARELGPKLADASSLTIN